jgi:hypothetical protein
LTEEAFCLAGLLKDGKSLERVTNLLPPGRREIVLRLAGEFSDLTSHELRKKLLALREAAVLQLNTRLTAELGAGWRELPPFLQCWLRQAVPPIHGNEDHQA